MRRMWTVWPSRVATAWLVGTMVGCGGGGGGSGGVDDRLDDGGKRSDREIAAPEDAGADTLDAEAPLDLSCVQMRALRSYPAGTSAVAMLFTVNTCRGEEPVPNLTPSDFVISEDDAAELSSEADPGFVPSRGRRVYITLVLDMSKSTSSVLEQLIDGAKGFVDKLLVEQQINAYIGLEVFDGAADTTAFQLPIDDADRIKARLDELRDYAGPDPSSTNLNGAVVSAITKLQTRQQQVMEMNDKGVTTQGYVVLFTDGDDTSDLVEASAARQAIANARDITITAASTQVQAAVDTYAVALKSVDYKEEARDALLNLFSGQPSSGGALFPDGGLLGTPGCINTCAYAFDRECDELGRGGSNLCAQGTDCADCGSVKLDGGVASDAGAQPTGAERAERHVFEAENPEELEQSFEELASRIADQLKGTYLLAYCSPKRRGPHTLRIALRSALGDAGSRFIEVPFTADGFQPGCSAAEFTSSCDDRTCGGFNCGACDDETEVCDAQSDRCINACLNANSCSGATITNPLGHAQSCEFDGEIRACGGQCVDTRSDRSHCGACGTVCPAGSECNAGSCECATAGLEACSTGCFDLKSDEAHCGSCTNVCPSQNGQGSPVQCDDGVCDCGGGLIGCSQNCVDPSSNPQHCGGCDIRCPYGSACEDGVCTCPTQGTTLCGGEAGDPLVCVDMQTRVDHCGACDNDCGASAICSNGACSCTGGTSRCGDACVNRQTDRNHCGACGTVCSANQVCQAGACQAPFAACSDGSFPAPGAQLSGTITSADQADCADATTYGIGQKQYVFVPSTTGYYYFGAASGVGSVYVAVETGACPSGPMACWSNFGQQPYLTAGVPVRVRVVANVSPGQSVPFTASATSS